MVEEERILSRARKKRREGAEGKGQRRRQLVTSEPGEAELSQRRYCLQAGEEPRRNTNKVTL